MNPIVINITLGMERQQGLSFIPNVATNTTFNHTILQKSQKEKLMIRLNQLITNVINETIESTIIESKRDSKLSRTDKQWLKKVSRILIDEVSNSQFNVDSLASVLSASRSKVHRQIKRITGLTPNKYIRQIKLQTARDILEKGEVQTVSEVCYAVGFDTPKYFSKIYEQQFGKRPLSYFRMS